MKILILLVLSAELLALFVFRTPMGRRTYVQSEMRNCKKQQTVKSNYNEQKLYANPKKPQSQSAWQNMSPMVAMLLANSQNSNAKFIISDDSIVTSAGAGYGVSTQAKGYGSGAQGIVVKKDNIQNVTSVAGTAVGNGANSGTAFAAGGNAYSAVSKDATPGTISSFGGSGVAVAGSGDKGANALGIGGDASNNPTNEKGQVGDSYAQAGSGYGMAGNGTKIGGTGIGVGGSANKNS